MGVKVRSTNDSSEEATPDSSFPKSLPGKYVNYSLVQNILFYTSVLTETADFKVHLNYLFTLIFPVPL